MDWAPAHWSHEFSASNGGRQATGHRRKWVAGPCDIGRPGFPALQSGSKLNVWLVVWNIYFMFPYFSIPRCSMYGIFTYRYIGNVIIPTDEVHHFSGGWRKPPTSNALTISDRWTFEGPAWRPRLSLAFLSWPHSARSLHTWKRTSVDVRNMLIQLGMAVKCILNGNIPSWVGKSGSKHGWMHWGHWILNCQANLQTSVR